MKGLQEISLQVIMLQIPVQCSLLLMTAPVTLKRRGLKRYVSLSYVPFYFVNPIPNNQSLELKTVSDTLNLKG